MTPLPALPDDRPESIRRVERAWRDADYCLHVEDVPAWLPTLDDEKKALASLSKAWPVLSKHADHIDGEFDLALTDVRRMFASFRAEIEAYAALTHGAHADTARLDWLENAENNVEVDARYPNIKSVRIQRAGQPMHTAGSVRAAIDAALAATRSTQGNQV